MIRTCLLLCVLHAFISNAHDSTQLKDVKELHDPRIGDDRLSKITLPQENLVVSGHDETKFAHIDAVPSQEIRTRFAKLLGMMDIDGDGGITREELIDWTYALLKKWDHDFSDHEFKEADTDKDDMMSLKELMKQKLGNTPAELEKLKDAINYQDLMKYEQYKDLEAGFQKYDFNKDNLLNHEEYHLLVHPWEFDFSRDEFIKRKLVMYDFNNDGKITAVEYVEDGLGIVEGRHDHDTVVRVFNSWDKNKDGFVEGEEIVWGWSYPDRLQDAKEAVDQIFDRTDDNKDGKLTQKETLKYYKMWSNSKLTNQGSLLKVTKHKQFNQKVKKDEL